MGFSFNKLMFVNFIWYFFIYCELWRCNWFIPDLILQSGLQQLCPFDQVRLLLRIRRMLILGLCASWSFLRGHIALSYDVVCTSWKSCHWPCSWWKAWAQADWLGNKFCCISSTHNILKLICKLWCFDEFFIKHISKRLYRLNLLK